AGKQQRRTVALDPVERVEGPCLQRHRSHARLRLGELELAAGKGAAHVDDTLSSGDVSVLACGPHARSGTHPAPGAPRPGPDALVGAYALVAPSLGSTPFASRPHPTSI